MSDPQGKPSARIISQAIANLRWFHRTVDVADPAGAVSILEITEPDLAHSKFRIYATSDPKLMEFIDSWFVAAGACKVAEKIFPPANSTEKPTGEEKSQMPYPIPQELITAGKYFSGALLFVLAIALSAFVLAVLAFVKNNRE